MHGDKIVKLSTAARAVHRRVQERLEPYKQNKQLGGGFRSYCDKLLGQWGRLCLVLGHIADAEVTEIDRTTAELAETLVFDHLLKHAARFMSGSVAAHTRRPPSRSAVGCYPGNAPASSHPI